ncbi:hypothetical protein TNCV_1324781 [Trichonephila clavipes]|nr:hypothetical protein TNCV_1324781 [Trichonephila clavipes]
MLKDGNGLTKIMKRIKLDTKFGKFGINIGQCCTEIMEWKPSDGRDYSTLIDVTRFSCTRALGDGPRNVEPFNVERRCFNRVPSFPKEGMYRSKDVAQMEKCKGENSNGPSMKQGKGATHRDKRETNKL